MTIFEIAHSYVLTARFNARFLTSRQLCDSLVFEGFHLRGWHKWIRTTDLALIRRAL